MTRREAGQKHSGWGPRARGRCVVVAVVFDVDLDQPVEEAATEDELEDGTQTSEYMEQCGSFDFFEGCERFEISEDSLNTGAECVHPKCFELLRILGKAEISMALGHLH
ncbi:hypothetical protein SRHO_G00216200 [Serrasalmus rhombeus]